MTKSRTRQFAVLLLSIGFCVVFAACGDDDDFNDVVMVVALSGDQEVPPVVTAGSGVSEIIIDEVAMEITVATTVDGIPADQLLMAHFHVAPSGENGPVVAFLLASPPPAPEFSSLVVPDDIIPNAEVGVEDFDDLVEAIRAGDVYINIHTPANPGGEIRGQTG